MWYVFKQNNNSTGKTQDSSQAMIFDNPLYTALTIFMDEHDNIENTRIAHLIMVYGVVINYMILDMNKHEYFLGGW